jgi:hypothetical protein
MLFEDQIEQGKEYLENLSSRVQESSLYIQLSDRFNSLSPSFQKFVIVFGLGLFIVLLISAPLANYHESVENMTAFEERKTLTQKVIDYNKNSSSQNPAPKRYNASELSREVKSLGKSYSINLLDNQISVSSENNPKKLITSAQQSNFKVKVDKANINQITALAYSIQKMNTSLILQGLEFKANSENPAYFDSSIEVANLHVKPAREILPTPAATKKKKRRRGGRR